MFSIRNIVLAGLALGTFLSGMVLFAAPMLREWAFAILPAKNAFEFVAENDSRKLKQDIRKLESSALNLQRKFTALTPAAPYLIVDTSSDRFYLMAGKKILRQGMCSTGSYTLLKTEDQRQWIFKTPRGMFRIQNKQESPVWRKPDWAFIEEGLPVPPPNAAERFEAGVLGEYGLYLGDGYLIHGTLYKRFLGMPVTHGCVRMGDEDLRSVYQNLQIGSKVFIF